MRLEKVETLKLRMRRRIRGARPVVVRGWNACTNIFKRRRKYLYVDGHVLQQKIKLLWHRTWKYLKSEEFLYVAAKLYSSYAGWWPLENCKWARKVAWSNTLSIEIWHVCTTCSWKFEEKILWKMIKFSFCHTSLIKKTSLDNTGTNAISSLRKSL